MLSGSNRKFFRDGIGPWLTVTRRSEWGVGNGFEPGWKRDEKGTHEESPSG